jgi:hypothetical protein
MALLHLFNFMDLRERHKRDTLDVRHPSSQRKPKAGRVPEVPAVQPAPIKHTPT